MHQHLVQNAELVAAPKRLLPQLVDWLGSRADDQQRLVSDDPIALSDALGPLAPTLRIVVLASGDPLWFGIGRVLIERLGSERLRFHPAPSSMQLAFARLGRPWQGAEWISLHGRDPSSLAQRLQKRPASLAVLTDPGRGGVEEVRATLRGSGLEPSYSLWLCEALGHHDERVQCLEANQPCPDDLHPLHNQ